MALIGGGGAGNVTGGNPSGTGTSLNYIGDHCYAYSGVLDLNGTTTVLSFDIASNQYIMAQMTPIYAEDLGDNIEYQIKINSEIIADFFISSAADTPHEKINFIIAPDSKVEVIVITPALREVGAMITGRVYG